MMMMKRKENQISKSEDECMKKKKKKKLRKIVAKSDDTNHISEDLIMEILLRLPPTSVIRFKQVCKTWYSLILNPDFLRTHYSSSMEFYKHNTDEELMVSSYLKERIKIKNQNKEHPLLKQEVFPTELLDFYVINSCNGLLLLLLLCQRRALYYVCNPITKHWFKIPNLSKEELKFSIYDHGPYILFDPSTSLSSYKVVKWLTSKAHIGNYLCDFYVYSSETGSWRLLRSFPCQTVYGISDPAVLLNGTFYWNTYNGDQLFCFDLKTESVWFISLPPKSVEYRECLYFGECDKRLRLIEKYSTSYTKSRRPFSFPCSFDIMEAEPLPQQHHGNLTWSMKYHVNVETGYYHLIKDPSFKVCIIRLYKTKKKGEEAMLLNINGKIVPFNLKSNTFGKALNSSCFSPSSDYSNVFPHIMSMFPLL